MVRPSKNHDRSALLSGIQTKRSRWARRRPVNIDSRSKEDETKSDWIIKNNIHLIKIHSYQQDEDVWSQAPIKTPPNVHIICTKRYILMVNTRTFVALASQVNSIAVPPQVCESGIVMHFFIHKSYIQSQLHVIKDNIITKFSNRVQDPFTCHNDKACNSSSRKYHDKWYKEYQYWLQIKWVDRSGSHIAAHVEFANKQ